MAGKVRSYSAHCVLALVLLAVPLLVSLADSNSRPDLVGIVIAGDPPVFSWPDWFDGLYQKEREDFNDDHWAFKETMVRMNNQLYFKAFNQIRVNGFVAGKDKYVFAEGYIFSAFGDDLMKEEEVKEKVRKLKVLQDTLKRKNIDLVLGLVPGKGANLKEFIPEKYVHPVRTTNHQMFREAALSKGVNLLDLYSYFLEIRDTTRYPLFTRFGHHWSFYGECLAVDTIGKYIEKLRNTDMPAFSFGKIEVSDTARSRDADILRSMNLMSPPEQDQKLAYPDFSFENDSSKNTTKGLVIGDSYWYGPVYMGVSYQLLGDGDFWYYNNRVVPRRENVQKEVWELDLKQEIEKYKVIMLMYADGNLPSLGNGFIEDAYEMYTSPSTYYARKEKSRLIQTYAKQIRELPALLKKSTKKSNELMIPLDSAIKLDAMRMAGIR